MTDWPQGGGEMVRRIRALDWAATPLGPVAQWPQSRRTAVDVMLAAGHAMQLALGPERIVLYNDAYVPMLGERHPRALGAPFREAWPDVWNEIAPLVDRVFAGETVKFEDMPLVMTRHGYAEDTWWSFCYSPLRDESGAVSGLLNVTVDTSAKVRAERGRDEANARLQQNEARFRALVTAGGNAICTMSPDWRWIWRLDSQTMASSAPIEDWLPKYIPEADMPEVRAAMDEALRTRSPLELEHRVRRPGGGVGWELSRAVPLLGPDGEITEWFGAGSDVTARREAMERLHESREKYRSLFENMDQGYLLADVIFDDAGRPVDIAYVESNPAAARMVGGDFTGRRLSEINPAYEPYWYEIWGRVAVTGQGERQQRFASPDGAWYDFYVFKPEAENPESRRVAVLFQDVTQRKQEEARKAFLLNLSDALRMRSDPIDIQYTAMKLVAEQLDVMRATYFEVDADGDGFALATRHERNAVPLPGHMRLSDFGPAVPAAFRAGRTVVFRDTDTETHLCAEPGMYRPLGMRAWIAVPLVKAGRLTALIGVNSATPRDWTRSEVHIVEDVADRIWAAVERARAEAAQKELLRENEAARQALEAAGAAKDHFLAVLSHELRTPLTPIAMALRLLARREDLPADVRELARMGIRNVNAATRLIDDLLDVTQIARGIVKMDKAPVDLHAVIRNACEVCEADLRDKQQALSLDLLATAHRTVGDAHRLQQLAWNLLKNASKFTPAHGAIRIATTDMGGRFVMTVQDDGMGIAPEALTRIFDAFVQAGPGVAQAYGGLGLGLSISRAAAEAHGGTLRAASDGPGRGATFTLELPLEHD